MTHYQTCAGYFSRWKTTSDNCAASSKQRIARFEPGQKGQLCLTITSDHNVVGINRVQHGRPDQLSSWMSSSSDQVLAFQIRDDHGVPETAGVRLGVSHFLAWRWGLNWRVLRCGASTPTQTLTFRGPGLGGSE